MGKKIFALLIFCLMSFMLPFNIKLVFADKTYFARIEQNDVYIYSNAENQTPLFELPKTYFVELIKIYNDEFYYAKYIDVYGYVKKSEVVPVQNIPLNPFATSLTFRVFVPSGAKLRSSPKASIGDINLIKTVNYMENNFIFYGPCVGEQAIVRRGNIWYYAKYYCDGKEFFGYIYADLCDEKTQIYSNNEIVTYVSGELNFEENIPTSSELLSDIGLNPTLKTILIIAVCLPCLGLIYLLFKPTQIAESIKNENKNHKNKKIKRLKSSDYYELDDDF